MRTEAGEEGERRGGAKENENRRGKKKLGVVLQLRRPLVSAG